MSVVNLKMLGKMDVIIQDAKSFIQKLGRPGVNATVIFDIDDTLLSKHGERIEPVVGLYNNVKELGYNIAIITARTKEKSVRDWTTKQLHSAGITGYMDIYYRPELDTNIKSFKEAAREDLLNRGYMAVMSVGDMWWDVGNYGGKPVIVPVLY